MLDAAHGDSISPIGIVQRVNVALTEPVLPGVAIVGSVRGRLPTPAAGTDARQGSRHVVAVARSKHNKQSLE